MDRYNAMKWMQHVLSIQPSPRLRDLYETNIATIEKVIELENRTDDLEKELDFASSLLFEIKRIIDNNSPADRGVSVGAYGVISQLVSSYCSTKKEQQALEREGKNEKQ